MRPQSSPAPSTAARVPATAAKPKVIFVLGWVRSGTTLLDTLLGANDGFFSGGEIRYLWDRGLTNRWMCGCRRPLPECPVWVDVLERMYGQVEAVPAATLAAHHLEVVRSRRLPQVLRQRPGNRSGWISLDSYTEALDRLYTSISAATGARVVIDSSKFAQDAALLRLLPSIDPYYVHLIRDPRAVAYSNTRRKASQPDPSEPVEMARWSSRQTATRWMRFNLAAEMVTARSPASRSLRLRYEDLVAHPRQALGRILTLVQEQGAPRLADEHTARLGENHTVWGNPARFARGEVPLRLDDEWRSSLPSPDRTTVTLLSLPLLLRYGYPLRERDDGGG